jgi:hypothetical protein
MEMVDKNVSLENLRPWEKLEFVIRRHWIIYIILKWYLLWWILFSSIILYFVWSELWWALFILLFWMVYSIFLYIERLNHELDMFVITNNRVIFIEQKSFLSRSKTECNLWQIQEVKSTTTWLFANLLWYWRLQIVTAWSTEDLEMWLVPTPLIKVRKILNIADKYRDKHSYRQKEDNN